MFSFLNYHNGTVFMSLGLSQALVAACAGGGEFVCIPLVRVEVNCVDEARGRQDIRDLHVYVGATRWHVM